MQGYLFSPPKPAADIRQLLLSRRDRRAASPPNATRRRRRLPSTA